MKTVSDKATNNRWSKNDVKFLRDNYKKLSAADIATKLCRSEQSVQCKAFAIGLKKGFRKYVWDLDFWSKQNLRSSYWAGFIAADGTIRDKGNVQQIVLTLSKKDSEQLRKFVNDINYNGPMFEKTRISGQTGKTYYAVGVALCGAAKAISDLRDRFSITSKKSLTLQPPKYLDLNNSLAFISGIIDGDGTISLDRSGRLSLSILGTETVLMWIKSIFDKLVPPTKKHNSSVRLEHKTRGSKVYVIKISGSRAKAICAWLLQANIPRMERKWDIAIAARPARHDKKFFKERSSNGNEAKEG